MWMKLLGAVLVITACTGAGASAVYRLRERKRLLETLKRMVSHLRGEILYANAPLPSAFYRTGRRGSGKAAGLFISVAEEMERETGDSFEHIWERRVKELFQPGDLSPQDREQLLKFGANLGYLDRDMQEKTIQFYLEDLELAITHLRREEPDKSRLYLGMGILSGLFLTVVLI